MIVFPDGFPIEIQVRTPWQHIWAEMFERLGDTYGREIRYGLPPRDTTRASSIALAVSSMQRCSVESGRTISAVTHFLIIYDRAAGNILRKKEFATGADALQARFDAEAEFGIRENIEIVALSAASEDELRRTHGRYFLTLEELAGRGLAA